MIDDEIFVCRNCTNRVFWSPTGWKLVYRLYERTEWCPDGETLHVPMGLTDAEKAGRF